MPALLLFILLSACTNSEAPTGSQSGTQPLAVTSQAKLALAGRITDAVDILNDVQEANLTRRLRMLEEATGHQMVVVTVSTLGGQDIASFATELGNAWGIGRADKDDGVVVLVSPNERKVRIAVGYGLEQKLPNALCKGIIDEEMLPRFRDGNLPGGIEAGVMALAAHLAG